MYTEETAGPGLWKSEIVAIVGLWLIASAFIVPPGNLFVYNNWFLGMLAVFASIAMAGNRKWERPLAAGAAIWLVISGFVPLMLDGRALLFNQVGVGVLLVIAATSAHFHLRDDIRHGRPLTM